MAIFETIFGHNGHDFQCYWPYLVAKSWEHWQAKQITNFELTGNRQTPRIHNRSSQRLHEAGHNP